MQSPGRYGKGKGWSKDLGLLWVWQENDEIWWNMSGQDYATLKTSMHQAPSGSPPTSSWQALASCAMLLLSCQVYSKIFFHPMICTQTAPWHHDCAFSSTLAEHLDPPGSHLLHLPPHPRSHESLSNVVAPTPKQCWESVLHKCRSIVSMYWTMELLAWKQVVEAEYNKNTIKINKIHLPWNSSVPNSELSAERLPRISTSRIFHAVLQLSFPKVASAFDRVLKQHKTKEAKHQDQT